MTAEERLAKVRTILKSDMVKMFEMFTSQTEDFDDEFLLTFPEIGLLIESAFTKWSLCLDPENVIDMYELEQWKSKVKEIEEIWKQETQQP
jgi:hypothetical protein